jgi:hypothetical protein
MVQYIIYVLLSVTARQFVAMVTGNCVMNDNIYKYKIYINMFENSMLRRTFGAKKDEMVGIVRKLHNEELHNLFSSPSIIRMIKSRRIRLTRHVARKKIRGMHIGFWKEIQKSPGRPRRR